MVCIRCGDPGHFVTDCPHPYRPVLDPRFPTNTNKATKQINLTEDSNEPSIAETSVQPNTQTNEDADRGSTVKTLLLNDQIGQASESPDNELRNLRPNFYKAQNEHVIQMATEMSCFELKSSDFGAEKLNQLAILIDSGAPVQYVGGNGQKLGFNPRNWSYNQVTNCFVSGLVPP